MEACSKSQPVHRDGNYCTFPRAGPVKHCSEAGLGMKIQAQFSSGPRGMCLCGIWPEAGWSQMSPWEIEDPLQFLHQFIPSPEKKTRRVREMQLRGDLYRNNGWSSGDGVLSSDGGIYGTYVFDLHHLRFTDKAKEFWIFDKALTIVLVLQRRRFKLQSCLWCSICLRSGAKDFW